MSADTSPPPLPSSEMLIGILNTIDCGLLVVAGEEGVIHANAWARRMLGIDATIAVEALRTMGGEDWRKFVTGLTQKCGSDRKAFVLQTPAGVRLVMEATVQCVLAPPGHPLAGETIHIATLTDTTRHHDFERQLQDMNRHLSDLSDTTIAQALTLKESNASLEHRIQERTQELHDANLAALRMLAIASEARDADTGEHVLRIKRYVELLAGQMGLSARQARIMGNSAILHDIGKIHVPDRILLKPGPLTPEERKEMQEHTVIGERILAASQYFAGAAEIARSHHENWDGSGYPDGKTREEIVLAARITHVADVFDALATARVYKEAWPPAKAVRAIQDGRSTQFDPEVVEAFETLVRSGAMAR